MIHSRARLVLVAISTDADTFVLVCFFLSDVMTLIQLVSIEIPCLCGKEVVNHHIMRDG